MVFVCFYVILNINFVEFNANINFVEFNAE